MRLPRRAILPALFGLGLATLCWPSAHARRGGRDREDDDYDDDSDDHAAAARARAAGEIRPLIEILEHVKVAHPGEVVGVELERKKGRWIYEIKLVAPGGRFLEIYVDAHDKSMLKIEGK